MSCNKLVISCRFRFLAPPSRHHHPSRVHIYIPIKSLVARQLLTNNITFRVLRYFVTHTHTHTLSQTHDSCLWHLDFSDNVLYLGNENTGVKTGCQVFTSPRTSTLVPSSTGSDAAMSSGCLLNQSLHHHPVQSWAWQSRTPPTTPGRSVLLYTCLLGHNSHTHTHTHNYAHTHKHAHTQTHTQLLSTLQKY